MWLAPSSPALTPPACGSCIHHQCTYHGQLLKPQLYMLICIGLYGHHHAEEHMLALPRAFRYVPIAARCSGCYLDLRWFVLVLFCTALLLG